MKLYAFASADLTNIWAGVGAQRWAVPLSKAESSNSGRATKAAKMLPGSAGILYSSEDKCFTSPFIVRTLAQADEIITHIWPREWTLAFEVRYIGSPHKRLSWDDAKNLLPSCKSGTPLSKLIHVEPLTVFAASQIDEADWAVLIDRLADR